MLKSQEPRPLRGQRESRPVMKSRLVLLSTILAASLLTACGPATFTRKTYVWQPFDQRENRQQKDNVTVELKFVDELPPSFFATVAACDQYGRVVVNSAGRPVAERITLGTNDQVWQQIAITNGTENVLRLNGVVVRLFDPAGSQFNVLTMTDLRAELLSKRPCPSTQQAMGIFAANAIFDRNIEVVPGTTSTFWVAFRPASRQMAGIWKVALYDVPVSLDPAGRPLRTTRFETRITVKEVDQTFRRESLMTKPELIESRETSATGTTVTTPQAAAQPATPSRAAEAPAPAPVRATAAAEAPVGPPSPAVIAQAQAKLNGLGFKAGVADGIPGARTQRAISDFQRSRNLTVSGQLDTETLKALGL